MRENDRRRFPRIQTSLPTRFDLNGTDIEGVSLNIGLGGVHLNVRTQFLLPLNYPVRVSVVTDAGAVEINGRILGSRPSGPQDGAISTQPACALAIGFDPVEPVADRVFSSILDGLRDNTISVSLTVRAADAVQTAFPLQNSDSERRIMPRIRITLPTTVAPASNDLNRCGTPAMVNLSATGACLDIEGQLQQPGDRVCLTVGLSGRSDKGNCNDPGVRVEGEIVWIKPTQHPQLGHRYRAGVRFLGQSDDSRRQIVGLVGQVLFAEEHSGDFPTSTTITSEAIECRNEHRLRIVGYLDRPPTPLPGSPVVVVSPDYAESKQAYVTLAYYLATNGFHVLRYDHSNHVGQSEGELVDTTLSGFTRDLSAVLNLLATLMPASPVGVIAAGMAGRTAIKAVAVNPGPKLLVVLSGIVDLQQACIAVHKEDLVVKFLRGSKHFLSNLFGLHINLDHFLQDAIKEGYADLRSTQREVEQIQAPIVFFASEEEPGGGRSLIEEIISGTERHDVQLHPIPQSLRRLHEDARKERALFQQVVSCCISHLCPSALGSTMVDPVEFDIGRQNRLERQGAKALQQKTHSQKALAGWDYREHFDGLANVPEYWHLLDQVARRLGPLPPGSTILDVGCGCGNFGMFLLLEEMYRRRMDPDGASQALRYLGLDGESAALLQARRNFSILATPALVPSLTRGDVNGPFPFRTNQFAGIICNLVLGYLEDPVSSLQEMLRVMAPGGRIILTSLKPYADLIAIYRKFLVHTDSPEEIERAERLLNTTCKIKQAESDGHLRFFQPQELATLLMMSGAAEPRITSALGNQAYIVVAEKCRGNPTECVEIQSPMTQVVTTA